MSKLSARIILILETQSLCNLDAPVNVVFCVSGFSLIDLLKIDCQSVKLPCLFKLFKKFKKLVARNDVPSFVRWRPSRHNKSFPILSLHVKSKPLTLHKCFNELFIPHINLLRLLSFLTRSDEIAILSIPNIYISNQFVRFISQIIYFNIMIVELNII